MKNPSLAAVFGGALTLAAVPSSASELCGIGFIRDPLGNCVARDVVVAPVVVAPVVAPRAVVAPGAAAVRGPEGAAAVRGPNGGGAVRGPEGRTYVRR
jgi:hypothetical protein